jgi:hypothetical protein
MKAIADTLGVARSNLVEAARGQRRSRQPYRKAGDAELLAGLRQLVDERPTYGYRRLAALLNRERRTRGEPPVNGKRVLRVLRTAGLTLQATPRAGPAALTTAPSWRSARTSGGVRITARSPAATAASSACCSPSTPATARFSAGTPPRPASRARWSET